jgi:hypothetical protein
VRVLAVTERDEARSAELAALDDLHDAIEERSGRNPRCLSDLLDLLVAIALDDAS